MGKTGCAILRCEPSKTSGRHRFPNPSKNETLFQIWLEQCDGKLKMFSGQHVYEHCRVCLKHLTEDCFGPNNTLKRGVIPTLFTSVIPQEHSITQPQSSNVDAQEEFALSIQSTSADFTVRQVLQHVTKETTMPKQTKSYLKKRIRILTKKNASYRKRLREATSYASSIAFRKVSTNLNEVNKNFFKSQIQCAGKNRKGYRFSTDDKITALALYKQCGSGYKLLSQLFALPTRQTLAKLLNSIPIKAGMNNVTFNGLQQVAKQMKPLDRVCFIIFDEMSIMPQIIYNRTNDQIEGFESFGDVRSENIADHVQVFMLRGVNRKWKQPVLYHFVQSSMKAAEIAKILRELIVAVNATGLQVVGTICDQGTNNVRAIKQLVEETRSHYLKNNKVLYDDMFEIENQRIIPLYDFPHLIKGVRNNLLTKDIGYKINNVQQTAKWQHIDMAWQLDSFSGDLRAMPKLTELHINKNKMKKMKVSTCTQIFSHTVASAINLMAKTEYEVGTLKMDKNATQTADFLKFFDALFDSVNGSGTFNKSGKQSKTKVDLLATQNVHITFWQSAINTLRTLHTIDHQKGKISIPPTFNNWQMSLKNMILLCDVLRGKGFTSFNPRNLNQDPLENFFGTITQRGSRYVNPTCSAFGQFYKSVLVNNLISKHSIGANCEEDGSQILLTLNKFLSDEFPNEEDERPVELYVQLPDNFTIDRGIEEKVIAYVAGYILKRKCKINNCVACRYNVLKRPGEEDFFNDFIRAREYGGVVASRLQYCNHELLKNMLIAYNIIKHVLKTYPTTKNVVRNITRILKQNVCFNFIECEHSTIIQNSILTQFSLLVTYNYCKGINNIITGKDERPLPDNASAVYQQAKRLYNKRK